MTNETYGTLTIVVSRETNKQSKDEALYESECMFNDYNVEQIVSEFLKQHGLKVHNVDVEWSKFYNDEE